MFTLNINVNFPSLEKALKIMSEQLDRLTTEVAENSDVIGSAVTLLGNLSQQIRDLKDDPAALDALADDLDAQSNALAAAVAANTPQEGGAGT